MPNDQNHLSVSLKRFILTTIDSVPHLEAILLLRCDPSKEWDVKTMSQTIYVSEKKAEELLVGLCASGFAAMRDRDKDNPVYCYKPVSSDLRETMDELSESYTKNLIEITHLIHSKTDKQAQQFGDAFKWKNKEG